MQDTASYSKKIVTKATTMAIKLYFSDTKYKEQE